MFRQEGFPLEPPESGPTAQLLGIQAASGESGKTMYRVHPQCKTGAEFYGLLRRELGLADKTTNRQVRLGWLIVN